jgi:hypothetical protein
VALHGHSHRHGVAARSALAVAVARPCRSCALSLVEVLDSGSCVGPAGRDVLDGVCCRS